MTVSALRFQYLGLEVTTVDRRQTDHVTILANPRPND